MERQEAPYVMKEAALIFESGAQADLDLVLGVSAPQSLRIHRVMKRDQVSREDVLARIDKQMDESIKMKLCDAVILNNDREALIPQVMSWHQVWINERK
jgi:dephospho-CoA kinase